MNGLDLAKHVREYLLSPGSNSIPKEKALSAELVSARMFEEPLIAITDACNPKFRELQSRDVIGEHFMLPGQWLPGAKSVVSFFFPFTEAIRESNKADMLYPSKGWLNGRIEGQLFINSFSRFMVALFNNSGYKAVSPSVDQRFLTNAGADNHGFHALFTSNWSERHVAYVCGMGTFGLSRGLITAKGMAGRFTSVITEQPLLADKQKERRFDEDCIMCGKCAKNCPAKAISLEHGKDHEACSKFLNSVLSENRPWYGCGKCQVNVPCESKNPRK